MFHVGRKSGSGLTVWNSRARASAGRNDAYRPHLKMTPGVSRTNRFATRRPIRAGHSSPPEQPPPSNHSQWQSTLPKRVVHLHSGWHIEHAVNLLPTHEDRCRDHHTKGNRRCQGSRSVGRQAVGSGAAGGYDHIAPHGPEPYPTGPESKMDVIGLAGCQRLPRQGTDCRSTACRGRRECRNLHRQRSAVLRARSGVSG